MSKSLMVITYKDEMKYQELINYEDKLDILKLDLTEVEKVQRFGLWLDYPEQDTPEKTLRYIRESLETIYESV